jgi:Resolvase, N terminal domain
LGQRAVLYCRVSTADQSCARQERDLTAFAARAGYEVVGVFKETGSGAKLDRAERKKAVALAQRREIDAVLVTELSRWGRSTLDLLHTLRELEARGVSVIAMNGLTFDLSTPHGQRPKSDRLAPKSPRARCHGAQLSPHRPRVRTEQEYRRRNRQTDAGLAVTGEPRSS